MIKLLGMERNLRFLILKVTLSNIDSAFLVLMSKFVKIPSNDDDYVNTSSCVGAT